MLFTIHLILVTHHCQFQLPCKALKFSPGKKRGVEIKWCFFKKNKILSPYFFKSMVVDSLSGLRPYSVWCQQDQGGIDGRSLQEVTEVASHCEITFIYPSEPNEWNCDGCFAYPFCAEGLTTAGDALVLCVCCFESHKPSLYASLDPSV